MPPEDAAGGGTSAKRSTPPNGFRARIVRRAAWSNLKEIGSEANTSQVNFSFVMTTNCTHTTTFFRVDELGMMAQMPSFLPIVGGMDVALSLLPPLSRRASPRVGC